VIIGHSERRAELQETDSVVRGKDRGGAAPLASSHPLRRRERARPRRGRSWQVVERQLSGSLPEDWEGELVIAYEPVWAIGTGNVATPGDVTEMHGAIRAFLTDRFGDMGGRIRILYGGSVKAGQCGRAVSPAPTSTAPWSAAPASPRPVRPDHRSCCKLKVSLSPAAGGSRVERRANR
jgi:triosephosphate isomerase